MGLLDGRVAIVTGAGGGLGKEHALLLAAQGAHVIVNDVSNEDSSSAATVADQIVAAGGTAVANNDSVADFDGAHAIVKAAIESFGDVHVVVNNAGILRDRMLVTMNEAEFDAVIAVHLKGTFALCRWAAEHWRDEHKSGRVVDRSIVNTTSAAGLHGNPGQANYAAAKAGVAGLTIVAAMELKRYGIRANCIAPIARTRMTQQIPGMSEALRAEVFDPGNVSPLVACLAAPDSPFTGQVFSVFGGSVGIYQGWSIAEQVDTEGRWRPDELRDALSRLPRRPKAATQSALLAEALAAGSTS